MIKINKSLYIILSLALIQSSLYGQSVSSEQQSLQPDSSQTTPQVSTSSSQKNGLKAYDPFLDNHLKAPPDGIRVGKFGMPIKEVETQLRLLGAKHYSYAFGKHSKMIMSSYELTISFDKNKRVGKVEVDPKAPLSCIEGKAKDFFIQLFTEGADLSQIALEISNNHLEMKFISPDT